MFSDPIFWGITVISISLLGLVYVGFHIWDRHFKQFESDPYDEDSRTCIVCGQSQVLTSKSFSHQYTRPYWTDAGYIIDDTCTCHAHVGEKA